MIFISDIVHCLTDSFKHVMKTGTASIISVMEERFPFSWPCQKELVSITVQNLFSLIPNDGNRSTLQNTVSERSQEAG
jgi:hypothetical protein